MSDDDIDYYQVLGVSEGATQEQIDAIYVRLMRTYHPDVNSDKSATEQTTKINAAYEILGNPINRREYDQKRSEYQRQFSPERDRHEPATPQYHYEPASRDKSSGFMRIVLKIPAALFWVVLLILELALKILSYPTYFFMLLAAIGALIISILNFFVTKNIAGGILFAVFALLLSPFGIPLITQLLIEKLRQLRCAIGNYVRS